VKTPLAAVKGYVQLFELIGQTQDLGPVAEHLPSLLRQVFRLEAVIEDFLAAAHLRMGDLIAHRQLVNLAALTEAVSQQVLAKTRTTVHDLVIDAPEPLVGEFDPEQLVYAIGHLARNAVQYSPEGGPVVAAAHREGDAALVSITDQGIGIPPEEHETIFRPFTQASNAGSLGGAGLGLYIADQMVRQHGGAIEVHSTPGMGSTFTLRLPLTTEPGQ
jgi:signal transduction histidine kinase